MKKTAIFFLAFCISIISYSQKKEERNVGSFNAISIGIPADVFITKGSTHKVTLEGDADDLEKVEATVEGNTLKIRKEDNDWWGSNMSRITVHITTSELTSLGLSGSGKVVSKDKFTSDEFEIDLSGSGRIELSIASKETDIDISGSGKVLLNGTSQEIDISISGSGEVEARDFKVAEADINIMGSGDCTISVSDKIDSKIMGSGNINYYGDPKHVNNNSMGSGKIRKM